MTNAELDKVREDYQRAVAIELRELAARGITAETLLELHRLARADFREGWARAVEIGMTVEPNGFGGPFGTNESPRWSSTITVPAVGDFIDLCIVEPTESA